jgi:hypothetical protein
MGFRKPDRILTITQMDRFSHHRIWKKVASEYKRLRSAQSTQTSLTIIVSNIASARNRKSACVVIAELSILVRVVALAIEYKGFSAGQGGLPDSQQ